AQGSPDLPALPLEERPIVRIPDCLTGDPGPVRQPRNFGSLCVTLAATAFSARELTDRAKLAVQFSDEMAWDGRPPRISVVAGVGVGGGGGALGAAGVRVGRASR